MTDKEFVESKLGKMTEDVSGFHYAVYEIRDRSGRFQQSSTADFGHAYECLAKKLRRR